MIQKIIEIGSSPAVIIPDELLELVGIKIGDEVEIVVNKKERAIIIKPIE